ncbi:MAG: nickel-dependent lactate racemase [Synergistaceae bacterium]|nr:nickel-dependent lactate racemase [Synergistaceae bacterium]
MGGILKYGIPYGRSQLFFEVPQESIAFNGEMTRLPALADFERALRYALDHPIETPALKELVRDKENILFLVEDATRNTPLNKIIPIVTGYLNRNGVPDDAISFLTAPGTHRVMTEWEIKEKLGVETVRRFKIYQHNASVSEDIADLGAVKLRSQIPVRIPVHVNRRALSADLLIGLGSIVPHSDAGFSGGAKILQPGVCDFVTTSATHAAAALCPDIPLGMVEGNPCREGIEAVARKIGLSFILNVVQNYEGESAGVFAGDFIKAHRAGVALSRLSFSVDVPRLADIVIVSSSPADMDYWQANKALSCAYFTVKKGGTIIFAAPCHEGLAHNHPRFREWLALPLSEVLKRLRSTSPEDTEADVVSAVLAVCNCRVRDKAHIFFVGEGLTNEDLRALKYKRIATVQQALDEALREKPDALVGILPKGGISLPRVRDAT